MIILDDERARTISVLRQLATGKVLRLPDGRRFAMADDMAIGPVIEVEGELRVSGLAEMTLSSFHEMLNKYEVGAVIG